MTNEQVALLITQYHRQLVDIFNQLGIDLEDVEGLEYHQVRGEWIGDEPAMKVGGRFLDPENIKRYDNPDNWEWKDLDPICLDDLSEFVDLIEDDIGTLMSDE